MSDAPDPMMEAFYARQDAVDDDILSHEAGYEEGRAIGKQALVDQKAAEQGNDDGDSGDVPESGSATNRHLVLDKATLDHLRAASQKIAEEFDEKGIKAAKSEDMEAVRGYPDLAGAIRSFYDNWKIRREGITKNVKKYADWIVQIDDGFGDTEISLAAGFADGDENALSDDLYRSIRENRAKRDA